MCPQILSKCSSKFHLFDLIRTACSKVTTVQVVYPSDTRLPGPNALAGLETALRRATRLQIAPVTDVQSMSEVGEYGRGFERMSNEGGIGVREIETVARCRKLSPPKSQLYLGFRLGYRSSSTLPPCRPVCVRQS